MLAYVVNRSYVRRAQGRCGAGFFEESLATVRVILVRGGQEFQRDLATEPCVFRYIHFAHAARAETFSESVMKYKVASHTQVRTATTARLLTV